MRKTDTGLTLMELIIAITLMSVLISVLIVGHTFVYRHVLRNIRVQNAYLQVDYALENIRLHCLSATAVDDNSYFPAGSTSTRDYFNFRGEKNVYKVTPDNLNDDVVYSYKLENDNFVLKSENAGSETLIDKQYHPQIAFKYTQGTEPNFLTVEIKAEVVDFNISKSEGIRFWFVDVVR